MAGTAFASGRHVVSCGIVGLAGSSTLLYSLDRRRSRNETSGGSSSSNGRPDECKTKFVETNFATGTTKNAGKRIVRCDASPDVSLPRAATLPTPKRLWTIDCSKIRQVQEVERERSLNRAQQVQDDLLDTSQVGTRKSGEAPRVMGSETGAWAMFCDVLPTFLDFFGTMSTFDAAASWVGLGYLAIIYAPTFQYPISQSQKHIAELVDHRRYFDYCAASYGPLLCLPKMVTTRKANEAEERKTKARGLHRTITRLIDPGNDDLDDVDEYPCPSSDVPGGRLAKDLIADHCRLEPKDIILYEPHSDWLRPSHFVALANDDKELIISIRGTFSLSDLLVDLSACQVDIGIDNWGPGHRGFLRGAAAILVSCLRVLGDGDDSQAFSHRLNRVEKITVCGHSLGGAVAAYVALFLNHSLRNPNPLKQHTLPKVQAITFGSPGVLDARRADSPQARELVTSYVVDLDLATRLSFTHMMELRDESVKAASVMSVANVAAAASKSEDHQVTDRVKLYPGGRRILLWQEDPITGKTHRAKQADAHESKNLYTNLDANQSLRTCIAEVGLEPFQRMPLAVPAMWLDHMPWRYEKLLNNIFEDTERREKQKRNLARSRFI